MSPAVSRATLAVLVLLLGCRGDPAAERPPGDPAPAAAEAPPQRAMKLAWSGPTDAATPSYQLVQWHIEAPPVLVDGLDQKLFEDEAVPDAVWSVLEVEPPSKDGRLVEAVKVAALPGSEEMEFTSEVVDVGKGFVAGVRKQWVSMATSTSTMLLATVGPLMPKAQRKKLKKKLKAQLKATRKAVKSMRPDVLAGTHLDVRTLRDGELTTEEKDPQRQMLFGLLFRLPSKPVKLGDTWATGVTALPVQRGLRVVAHPRFDRVRLAGIEDGGAAGPIATIEYVFGERLDGRGQKVAGVKPELTLRVVGVARGEFVAREGRWRRWRAVTVQQFSGMMEGTLARALSLEPGVAGP